MFKTILLFVLLLPSIHVTMAEGEMTSDLICPCECAMIISTCDCPTAIQVKKEIAWMKESGFSGEQILSALKSEYGRDILIHPEKADSMPLWLVGIPLALILAFIGFIITRRPNADIIPDREKYEKRFEEEYRRFVSELEET